MNGWPSPTELLEQVIGYILHGLDGRCKTADLAPPVLMNELAGG